MIDILLGISAAFAETTDASAGAAEQSTGLLGLLFSFLPFILIFVHIWKSFGYSSVIYFASIVGIDRTYYEAAEIDGASAWDQVWSITIPLLKPVIITMTLLALGRVMYSSCSHPANAAMSIFLRSLGKVTLRSFFPMSAVVGTDLAS